MRADSFISYLYSRPERNIMVISHGVFLESVSERERERERVGIAHQKLYLGFEMYFAVVLSISLFNKYYCNAVVE